MRRFRIGNNLSINWSLYDSDNTPHDFEGKELILYMTCGGFAVPVKDYTVNENVISWTFLGPHQFKTGPYKVILVEKKDAIDFRAVDYNEAFMLVPVDYLLGNTAVTEGDATLNIRSVISASSGESSGSGSGIDRIETEVVDGNTIVTIILTDERQFTFTIPAGAQGPSGSAGAAGAPGAPGESGMSMILCTQYPESERNTFYFDTDFLSSPAKAGDIIIHFSEWKSLYAWRVAGVNGSSPYAIYPDDVLIEDYSLGSGVIDNLESSDPTRALSANQGRILKSLIDAISPGGGDAGVETKYSSVTNPGTPTSDASNWHTDRLITDTWMAIRFMKNGEWGDWTIIRIGEQIANSSYQAFVFKRSNANSVSAPTGGTYADPTDGLTTGWSDGVPSGTGMVWMSTRIFSSDGEAPQEDEWTTPRKVVDSDTMDFEFSSAVNPGTPNKLTPSSSNTNPNWSNTATESTIWMAMRAVSNGEYAPSSSWMVVKIKGEKGEDGTGVNILGTKSDSSELPDAGNTTGDAYLIDGNLWVWDGYSWVNAGHIKGDPGKDGDTPYIHIKYSNDGSTFTANNGETPGDWIGIYWDYDPNDSMTFSKYDWQEWKGQDGFGYEYVFMLTQNVTQKPALPVEDWTSAAYQADDHIPTSAGSFPWTDDAAGVSETYPYCWVIWRRKINGVWTEWLGSNGYAKLFSHFGKDGATRFKSIVFMRSADEPDLPGPSEGSFADPVPDDWSDGVPALDDEGTVADNTLWMTTRIFSSDGNHQATWTPVQQATDTEEIDFEYSSVETGPGNPTTDPNNWHDTPDEDDWWMAIRHKINGNGSWDVIKIKGESGAPGVGITNIAVTYAIGSDGETIPSSGWTDDIEELTVPAGWWLWKKTVISYSNSSSVTTYDKYRQSVDGVSTACPFRGEFDANETYFGNSARTDIIYYPALNHYYRANPNAPSASFLGSASLITEDGVLIPNPDYWLAFGANYDNIATGFLFAEEANIANFLFHNEKLESVAKDSANNPRVTLDGYSGEIKVSGESQGTGMTYPQIFHSDLHLESKGTLNGDHFLYTSKHGPSANKTAYGTGSIEIGNPENRGFTEIISTPGSVQGQSALNVKSTGHALYVEGDSTFDGDALFYNNINVANGGIITGARRIKTKAITGSYSIPLTDSGCTFIVNANSGTITLPNMPRDGFDDVNGTYFDFVVTYPASNLSIVCNGAGTITVVMDANVTRLQTSFSISNRAGNCYRAVFHDGVWFIFKI